MRVPRVPKPVARTACILLVVYLVLLGFLGIFQRSMIYFPSHNAETAGVLRPWRDGDRTIGYCHEAPHAQTLWLMTHGNAGQAADRDFVLGRMSRSDSLYVLEYPGFGLRPGSPSLEAFNKAASEAYELLRARNPHARVCVLGESLGSGPACRLAAEKTPPDKIVLVVPYDSLANVAAEKVVCFPVRLILKDAWDNVAALRGYRGPVEIFAAENDEIIPVEHARALARQVTGAKLTIISGGHNDWADDERVKIR